MLKSMSCIYVPLALLTVFFLIWGASHSDTVIISLDGGHARYYSKEAPGGASGVGHSQFSEGNSPRPDKAVSPQIPNRPPIDAIAGHNTHGYRIVRDKRPTRAAALWDLMDISNSGDYNEPIVSDGLLEYDPHRDYLTFGDGSGGDADFGLGDNTFGLPGGIYCPGAARFPNGDWGYDDLNRPLFLGLRNPGFPAEADTNTVGKVVFEITVHEDSLINYRIKSVEPQCRGFYQATEYAIVNGKFAPRFIDGVPVKETIEVVLFFHWNDGQSSTTSQFTSVPGLVHAEWK